MEEIVRRSILLVSVADQEAIASCWRHGADAVVLDLGDEVPETAKPQARAQVREATSTARRGGAEVFVRINRELAHADLEASAWPGLTGIALPSPQVAADVRDAAEILAAMEQQHGIPVGSLQLFLLLGTAKGVWNVRELIYASPRVTSVALDGTQLCRTLGVLPRADFDPFPYAAGRLVIECTAARVQPVGISHPVSLVPRLLSAEEIHGLAERGRNMGFKGAICPHPSWVEPCNRAFTPTLEQVEFYREVRRLFGEGVARGSASVPMNGRMLDVPVDERAKKMITLWERCQRRDGEKATALQSHSG
ncbi:MAG: hypothetical protein HYY02_04850 [Chloroflexi bacterium]|nr:hypothetical protein [Chloroflexota bacterium]